MVAITCTAPLIRIPPNHRTYVHGSTMSSDLPWIDDGWRPVDGSTPVKLEVDSAGAYQILDSSEGFGGFVPFFFWWFSCALFSGGLVLIGTDRWFCCFGRGWIDVVCAVVERRWSSGWVVRYWSATLVRWVLLLRCSAVGWGWGRPGCFFFVVVQWVGVGGDRRVREKWKQKLKKMIKK